MKKTLNLLRVAVVYFLVHLTFCVVFIVKDLVPARSITSEKHRLGHPYRHTTSEKKKCQSTAHKIAFGFGKVKQNTDTAHFWNVVHKINDTTKTVTMDVAELTSDEHLKNNDGKGNAGLSNINDSQTLRKIKRNAMDVSEIKSPCYLCNKIGTVMSNIESLGLTSRYQGISNRLFNNDMIQTLFECNNRIYELHGNYSYYRFDRF